MSAATMDLRVDDRLKDRFWSKVRKLDGDNSCWLWTGASRAGYGSIKVAGKVINCHVLSWRLINGGIAIPSGKIIGHLCDVRLCVRPEHLKLMTQSENMIDANLKGRCDWNCGERAPNAVLTDEIVRKAKRMSRDGVSGRQIALNLGVSHDAIKAVLRGKTWKHVSAEVA